MDKQDPQPSFQALTGEHLQLRKEHERLLIKVGYLESRLGHLASSNTDLSSRLVRGEEDKLQISKELVEEKIQTNKMREQFEEEQFELKNKILNQNRVITEHEMERDKLPRELHSAEARLKIGEKSKEDLTEEFTTLKKNYLALTGAHDKEQAQSKELTAELLALAKAHDELLRKLEDHHGRVQSATQDLHGELDRVRALISSMSHQTVETEHLAASDKEQQNMDKTQLGNQNEIKDILEKMKNSYEEQLKNLKEKVVDMGKENQENKRAIHDSQKKLSEQSAARLCCQSQVKELEGENSNLQLQVKELNEEYRARLQCYLRDIAEYIDGLGGRRTPPDGIKMRAFVDSMMLDIRSSYRAREEQLASAARSYKKRLQSINKTHHALITAYRVQREQIVDKPEKGLEPGPPEAGFLLEPSELRDESEEELQQLRRDKARLEGQLQVAPEQGAVFKMPVETSCPEPAESEQICEESSVDIRKQQKETKHSALGAVEKERAVLLTRAAVAEAQVSELQDYIDKHLDRYKQEIIRLQKLHGKEEAARTQSAHPSTKQK